MAYYPVFQGRTAVAVFCFLVVGLVVFGFGEEARAWEGPGCSTTSGGSDALFDAGVLWPYLHETSSMGIRVYVQDMIRSDGSGGVPVVDRESALAEMVSAFDEIGVYLDLVGFETIVVPDDYVDSPWLYYNAILQLNPHDNSVGIYLGDPGGLQGGFASGIPGKEFVVHGPDITSGALVHEMGHCLGLRHTFDLYVCEDYPVGHPTGIPNCEDCGDLVCDTPVDLSTQGSDMYDYSTCSFKPYFFEIYGPFGYDPDPINYMHYYRGCWDHFTQGQIDRVFAAVENNVSNIGDVLYVSEAAFLEVSPQTNLNFTGSPYSSISIDYNGDNKKDLFVSVSDFKSSLNTGLPLDPNGNPVFSSYAVEFSDQTSGFRGVTSVDYDNDGDQDLFLSHGTQSKLFQNNSGSFLNVTVSMGFGSLIDNSTASSWGDYDRDGWLDLYVCRALTSLEPPEYPDIYQAGDRLFRNEIGEGGGFADATTSSGIGSHSHNGAVSVSWIDFDGDGDQDIFVPLNQDLPAGGSGLHSLLFVNQDDGTFTEEFALHFPGSLNFVTGAKWADLDNDGHFDLAFSKISGGKPGFYQNDGTGDFPQESLVYLDDPTGHSGVHVFDHDLDGRQDFLVLSNDSQRHSKFYSNLELNGQMQLVDATINSGLTDLGAVFGAVPTDFTGDGDADLYLGKPVSGGKFFFKTETTAGSDPLGRNYVKVVLSSPEGANNRSGVGAVVTVTAGSLVQTQVVDGGSGRGGQNDLELTFGLGSYASTVTAAVRWPGGNVQSGFPLVFSVQNSETINTIVDDTAPVVSNVSANSVFNPSTGKLDWTFSWETAVSCDPALDKLTFDQAGISNPCWPGWTFITPATPGVSHTYKAKPGGGYTHKFEFYNIDCIAKCSFRYYVTSGVGTNLNSCSPITKGVKVCPSVP